MTLSLRMAWRKAGLDAVHRGRELALDQIPGGWVHPCLAAAFELALLSAERHGAMCFHFDEQDAPAFTDYTAQPVRGGAGNRALAQLVGVFLNQSRLKSRFGRSRQRKQ